MVTIDPNRPPKGTEPASVKTMLHRQPKGTRDGGKFSEKVGFESEVDLRGESVPLPDGSNASEPVVEQPVIEERAVEEPPVKLGGNTKFPDGTWEYPPSGMRLAEVARFWATTEIPDFLIRNIEAGDKQRDFFVAKEPFDAWLRSQSWGSRRKKKFPEEFAEYQKQYQRRKDILDRYEFHVGIIPKDELRDVTRIGHFWQYLNSSGIREDVMDVRWQLRTGEVATTREIVDRYKLWEIQKAFFMKWKP
jgi:hypothetical protein